MPPNDWKPNPAVLGPLLAGLESSPILEAAAGRPALPNRDQATVPKVRVIQSPAASANAPAGFDSLRRTINSLATMMSGSEPTPRRASATASSLRRPRNSPTPQRARVHRQGYAPLFEDERDKFRLPTGGSITLTARKGAIPVTVRSSADYPCECDPAGGIGPPQVPGRQHQAPHAHVVTTPRSASPSSRSGRATSRCGSC